MTWRTDNNDDSAFIAVMLMMPVIMKLMRMIREGSGPLQYEYTTCNINISPKVILLAT